MCFGRRILQTGLSMFEVGKRGPTPASSEAAGGVKARQDERFEVEGYAEVTLNANSTGILYCGTHSEHQQIGLFCADASTSAGEPGYTGANRLFGLWICLI